jgi:hypothetical protein
MGLKELNQIIQDQYGTKDDTKLTALLARLKGKPFWIWNTEQHKQKHKETKGNCCFTCIIGWPKKHGVPKPMFDYEKLLYDALMNTTSIKDKFKDKHLWVKKATGLGITEFILRFMVWLCVYDDKYSGSQMVLVTGPSLEIALTLVKRLKSLFSKHEILFEFKETFLELNKVSISCYPSHHLDTFRALEKPSLIFLDEADFFPISEQQNARHISERYIGKSSPFLIWVSTPNAPTQLFDRIEQEPEETCIYKRFKLDWKYGLGRIFTQEEIDKSKASPSFAREYDLKYLGMIGNSFRTNDIERAQSFVYNPDQITVGVDRVISCDPAFGSSSTGITITSIVDDRIAILYSQEFERSTSEEMVNLIWDLYHKYYPIKAILIDASQISFIKSCKQAFINELREEIDYERQIAMFKQGKCDWRLNLIIRPCYFNEKSTKAMLGHLKNFVESGWIMIDKRFDKLLIALHTASDIEGKLSKSTMSHSDCFDALRMCTTCYGDFTW